MKEGDKCDRKRNGRRKESVEKRAGKENRERGREKKEVQKRRERGKKRDEERG